MAPCNGQQAFVGMVLVNELCIARVQHASASLEVGLSGKEGAESRRTRRESKHTTGVRVDKERIMCKLRRRNETGKG